MTSILSEARCSGIESVTMTRLSGLASMRSSAGPESSGCVQNAWTSRAPASVSAWAPDDSVPAVSHRSSISRQLRPSTSPMMFITSATFASGRRLSISASPAPSRLA